MNKSKMKLHTQQMNNTEDALQFGFAASLASKGPFPNK